MKQVEIPDCLPYPKLLDFHETNEFKDKFCYVLKGYPTEGIILLVVRKEGDVVVRLHDFEAQPLKLDNKDSYVEQVIEVSKRIILTMRYCGIPKGLFYFSNDNGTSRLIDARFSLNKFAGPGWLNDFLGRQGIPIQTSVCDPLILDEEKMEEIRARRGVFEQDLVFKPSAFKFITRGDKLIPLYGAHHAT